MHQTDKNINLYPCPVDIQ